MNTEGNGLREHFDRLRALSFKIGAYRPPSEEGSASLLLRVSENCPWNRCTFCEMYEGHRFVHRPVAQIKDDIDSIAAIRDEIAAVSWKLGAGGTITRDAWAARSQQQGYKIATATRRVRLRDRWKTYGAISADFTITLK